MSKHRPKSNSTSKSNNNNALELKEGMKTSKALLYLNPNPRTICC